MTKQKLSLLVIEDTPRHIEEAEKVWKKIKKKGIPLKVEMVKDKEGLVSNLEGRKYDGIISDIFYPNSYGGPEEENGTSSILLSRKYDTPIVLCTSTWHHGKKTQPVHDYCFVQGIPMVDMYRKPGDSTFKSKLWEDGYNSLLCQMALKKMGGGLQIAKDLLDKKVEWEDIQKAVRKEVSPFAIKSLNGLKWALEDSLDRIYFKEKRRRK